MNDLYLTNRNRRIINIYNGKYVTKEKKTLLISIAPFILINKHLERVHHELLNDTFIFLTLI